MSIWPPIVGRRRRAVRRFGRLALATLALSACGSAPRESFDLSGGASAVVSRADWQRATVLAVNEPEASPPLHPERIIIRTGPGEIAYLAGVQWADRFTRLVQERLVSALRRGGVAASLPGTPVDAALSIVIRRFEIDLTQQTAVVEILVRLTNDATGRERAARLFLGEWPAPVTTGAAAVQALEEALDDASHQMIHWVRGRIAKA